MLKTATRAPGPRNLMPLLEIPKLQSDPMGYLLNAAQKYGDVVHFEIGPVNIFMLSHPDDIRDVLVTNNKNFIKGQGLQRAKNLFGEGLLTSEGEFHLRQRRMIQPAFHRQRIAAYGETMIEYGAHFRECWRDGDALDFEREMMRLTLAIVGKTLFATDVEHQADEVRDALGDMTDALNGLTVPLVGMLGPVPSDKQKRFDHAKARLDKIIFDMIAEWRANPSDRGDLLSMLLMAQDVEGDGARMGDQQVRDEAITLFLAGHDTTAHALTWTFYLLAQNPDAEKKLHAELDGVLGDRLPRVSDLERLPYTRMVLSEAMRLYPPAWSLGRRAIADYVLRDYVIPAGASVIMSQWVVHHDARWYREPFAFEPERWTTEAQAARPKFAYFPFGGGPRMCIGDQFAWMEGTLLLATIAQQWQPRVAPDARVELKPMITLGSKHGVKMMLHQRGK